LKKKKQKTFSHGRLAYSIGIALLQKEALAFWLQRFRPDQSNRIAVP